MTWAHSPTKKTLLRSNIVPNGLNIPDPKDRRKLLRCEFGIQLVRSPESATLSRFSPNSAFCASLSTVCAILLSVSMLAWWTFCSCFRFGFFAFLSKTNHCSIHPRNWKKVSYFGQYPLIFAPQTDHPSQVMCIHIKL